jgi:hypothetical protein
MISMHRLFALAGLLALLAGPALAQPTSALPPASAGSDTDLYTVTQGTCPAPGCHSYKITGAQVKTYSQSGLVALTLHGDSIYAMVATDRLIATSAALTGSRTWTLMSAGAVKAGQVIRVADQAGGVTASNTLVIARNGSDTINGSATSITLSSAFSVVDLVSDGVSQWTVVGSSRPFTAPAHQFLTGSAPTTGSASAQPAFTDVSGTLAAAQFIAPTTSAFGGIFGIACPSHQWVDVIPVSAVQPTCAQPAFTDISGIAAAAQGGSGVASPTAHNLLLGEGASAFTPIPPGAAGQFPISQGAAADPAFEPMSGDATLGSTGAIAVAKIAGVAPGALYPLGAGQGLQVSGSSLQSDNGFGAVKQPGSTTLALANTDCGADVLSQSAGGVLAVTLPASPPTTCQFSFVAQTNAITLNPNGQSIFNGQATTTSLFTIPVPGANFARSVPVAIAFDGADWRFINLPPGQMDYATLLHGADQQLAHGQVYLSLTGSTLQLCPYNGPGGLIIGHQMRRIVPCDGSTSFGAQLPNTATTGSSVLNYIYAIGINAAISSADNTGCNGRITVANVLGVQPNDTVTIYNLGVATEGNGVWVVASLPDATHICLTGLTFTHTGADTGTVIGVGLQAATTAHVTDTAAVTGGFGNSVEVRSAAGASTLVGIVYVGAAQALSDSATKRDVLSWFNRQPKKMIVQDTNGRTWAAGTAGTFLTASAVIEGEFVVAGPPSLPGTSPVNSADWRLNASEKQTIADSCGLGVSFNAATQSGAAAVTAEAEWSGFTAPVSADYLPISVSGVATGLTEGRVFMDVAGWATTATCTLNTQAPGISEEAVVWQ